MDVRRPVTSSDVSDLIALADTARGPVGSQADVRDGERVITYAQWESQEHDRAMLDSPEARVPTDHAATIATDVQPRLFGATAGAETRARPRVVVAIRTRRADVRRKVGAFLAWAARDPAPSGPRAEQAGEDRPVSADQGSRLRAADHDSGKRYTVHAGFPDSRPGRAAHGCRSAPDSHRLPPVAHGWCGCCLARAETTAS